MAVTDLVRYNLDVRESYLEALAGLPWAEVVKPKGLSFDSARDVFLHITLVEDRWINYILQNRFPEWKDPDFETYKDIDALREYVNSTRKSTERFLKNLRPEDWGRKVTIPWGDKPDTQITIETALTHMVMEDMIHYGELSAMFWQMDREPPYLRFWRFKYNSDSRP
jgi:uncharacterized damage-inducible protein DinB